MLSLSRLPLFLGHISLQENGLGESGKGRAGPNKLWKVRLSISFIVCIPIIIRNLGISDHYPFHFDHSISEHE